MSQFPPRFRSTPPQSRGREPEVKLRMSPQAYPQENFDSAYTRRYQETQKIKNLSFWDNTDQEASEEEEWETRQSPTPFILVIIILVVASTLLWFLFRWASGEGSNPPPIIPADTAPFKVRPENPGGMMIPHQDKLVYSRLSQNTPQPLERLLPPPEQPMAAPPLQQQPPMPLSQQQPPNAPPQPQPYPQGQGYAPAPALQPGVQQQQPFQQGMPQPYPSFQAQAPYAQQQPLPNQPAYPTPPQSPYGPPMPYAVLPPLAPPAAAPPPQPLNLTPLKPSTIESIKPALDEEDTDEMVPNNGRHELDQLIAKATEAPAKQPVKKNTEKPVKLLPLDPRKHKIQVASLPSRSMAEQEMKRLRTHHGAIFGNKPWNIQKINLGPERGVTHRLVVGSFPNHNAATQFCKKLRAEKIGCLVVAPAHE